MAQLIQEYAGSALIPRAELRHAFLTATLVCAWTAVSFAQGTGGNLTAAYLKSLTLEDLGNLNVTTVSRREERVLDTAAAVHVITEEDIRRSGARSIPDALRLAPNLQVAQAGSRTWAISARGFSAPFANKLLVLIDGRSVYSPLFSGVFWNAQDTLLEDIDRIEVISGPGATMWGSNAVNGVINIITKTAMDTRGAVASVGAGTEERLVTGFRYGGAATDALSYRLYAKYFSRDHSVLADGQDAADAWRSGRAGFRLDRNAGQRDVLMVQGDVYDGRGEQLDAPDMSESGGHLLARWTRSSQATRQFRIQTYYDRTYQFVPEDFGDTIDTVDVDTQYEHQLGQRHHLMIGAGYRYTHDAVDSLPGSIAFLPATLDRNLFSTFVQDEIALPGNRVQLTIGSKFEHNDYTGIEVQPSGRIAWTPGRHIVWSALSRAVRTPSRFDRHLFFPANPPFTFAGGPNFDSEKVNAYELGWRGSSNRISASVSTFFNDYTDIRSTSPGPPFVTENNVEGEIYGVEIEATWQAIESWRLIAGYTGLHEDLRVKPGRSDLNSGQGETFDPNHQFQLRSSLNLPRDIEFDVWARYVGQVKSTGRGFGVVPEYLTLDTRLGWSPIANLQLAIVGQNLLDNHHAEFGSRLIERSLYGRATWRLGTAAP